MPQRLQQPVHVGVWIVRLALAAVVVWAVFAWLIRPNLVPVRFAEVEPGEFYRSAAYGQPAATERVVQDKQIRTIVDLVEPDADPARERVAARTAEALGVKRIVVPVGPGERPNPNAFVAALRVLNDPQMQPVLVRCPDGKTRTGLCEDLYRVVHLQPGEQGEPGTLPDWGVEVLRALNERGWVPGHPNFQTEIDAVRPADSAAMPNKPLPSGREPGR